MIIDRCIHLDYEDPARGYVPNPGMGFNGYVFSDHMHYGLRADDFGRDEASNPNRPLDRESFDRMIQMPYTDNLYFRADWNRLQSQPGKLHLPPEWEWMLEAVERTGKRWSFRVMNASPHSPGPHSVPDFLVDKLEMRAYRVFGTAKKYYPAYTDRYLGCWAELLFLLAERFDRHPLLEYVDVSGYGIWGEGHHYGFHGEETTMRNLPPSNVEEVVARLVRDHRAAFTHTPLALGLHYLDFASGRQALAEGLEWARRDSFSVHMGPEEYDAMTRYVPGRAHLWEAIIPIYSQPAPLLLNERLHQRYLDLGAHYVAVGFNPWDELVAQQLRCDIFEDLGPSLGYRIRPSLVLLRVNERGAEEIGIVLTNDGCVSPPGTITLTARIPEVPPLTLVLPMGEPSPRSRARYTIPLPHGTLGRGSGRTMELSLTLLMKGKSFPLRWAVRRSLRDPMVLPVALRRPPSGDPNLTEAGDFAPAL